MNKYYIAVTRFNNQTYHNNIKYKEQNNFTGCIYGVPVKIKDDIPLNSAVFVIEMNNDLNKIEGIGLIRNMCHFDKYHRIYKNEFDLDYNRYIYKGKTHIHVSKITNDYDKKVINTLEQLLFTTSRHSKRGQGITEMPLWIRNNK